MGNPWENLNQEKKDKHNLSVIDEKSEIKYFPEGTPLDHFETAEKSVYTYLPDGRTQRFKTAKNELNEPQNAIVFIPSWEEIKNELKEKYKEVFGEIDSEKEYEQILLGYVQKEEWQKNNGKKIYIVDKDNKKLETNEAIKKAGGDIHILCGKFLENGSFRIHFEIPVSQIPVIGYSTFDTTKYKKDGNWERDKHIGNKIVKIVRK